jgi:NAD(P)-dependent dehydrogenase (short-subunit alcohol dehydrogenase family)
MQKTILVTGGNRGIGKQICDELSGLGHRVFLGSRDLEKGKNAAAEMPGKVEAVQLDVASDESVKAAFDQISSKTDHLDVLINNAGIGVGNAGLAEAKLKEIKEIFEVNFFGSIRMNSVFLSLLEASPDPRIINMSSGMGQLSNLQGKSAGYRLSKAGLNAQTIQLANELAGRVKVYSMSPGWVRTDMGGSQAPRSLEQGADTAVWLALEDEAESGKMYFDREQVSW